MTTTTQLNVGICICIPSQRRVSTTSSVWIILEEKKEGKKEGRKGGRGHRERGKEGGREGGDIGRRERGIIALEEWACKNTIVTRLLISVLGLYCWDKTLWPITWGGKGLFQLTTPMLHYIIAKGSQGRNSNQKLKQKPQKNAAYGLLFMACSAPFLISPRPTCPALVSPTVGWAFLHQSLIKKVLQRL